jgi:superfamily II DNA or RNA helicase
LTVPHLVMKGNDYDEQQMAAEYSKVKHVQNTVNVYKQHAEGTKAMVFNCNVQHSILVMEAFINAGYDCRHVDANSDNRKAVFKWFMTRRALYSVMWALPLPDLTSLQ